MKKNGFTFVETIITIVVLTTALLLLYSTFSKLLQNEKKRLYYDDIVYLNRTVNIRNFLKTQNIDTIINELNDNDFYRIISSTTTNLFKDNGSYFFGEMKDEYNLDKLILISKNDINKLKECNATSTNNICTKSYAIDLGIKKYLKNISIDNECNYILVAKYSENSNIKTYNFYSWVCVDSQEKYEYFKPVELVTDGNKHDRRGKDGLSDNDTDKGMYRYQGTNTEVNNYICIGSDCSNAENIYRIIGIARDGRMKVIKMELSESGDSPYSKSLLWYWNSTGNGNSFDWTNATLRTILNNTSAGYYLASLGSYANYIDSSSNSKFYSNETSNGSTECISYSKSGESDDNKEATNLYALETGETIDSYGADEVDENNISYKVGLMQISDYYLAASDNANCSYSNGTDLITCKTSWLYFNNENVLCEWTASREDGFCAWSVNKAGYIKIEAIDALACGARPVFYLKANILLKGSGTKDDPYIIVGEG